MPDQTILSALQYLGQEYHRRWNVAQLFLSSVGHRLGFSNMKCRWLLYELLPSIFQVLDAHFLRCDAFLYGTTKIIEIKVYILRYIWCLSRHYFNRCYDIQFHWWYRIYELCGMFDTKVPYPTREILWHHLVMPYLLEIYNFNVNIVDFIGTFWLCIG